jgi:hypothetical protein
VLALLREKTVWPCFKKGPQVGLGRKGFRALGFHEKAQADGQLAPKTAMLMLATPDPEEEEAPPPYLQDPSNVWAAIAAFIDTLLLPVVGVENFLRYLFFTQTDAYRFFNRTQEVALELMQYHHLCQPKGVAIFVLDLTVKDFRNVCFAENAASVALLGPMTEGRGRSPFSRVLAEIPRIHTNTMSAYKNPGTPFSYEVYCSCVGGVERKLLMTKIVDPHSFFVVHICHEIS